MNVVLNFLATVMVLTFSANSIALARSLNSDGWTEILPSQKSRIMYLSTDGNDDLGKVYSPSYYESFKSQPEERPRAFRTFAGAFKNVRKGMPDWILVKRGDVFFESISLSSGFSESEPFVISVYGNDDSNPVFKTGPHKALHQCCHNIGNVIVQGLDFYAHTRNPNDSNFHSHAGSLGLNIYVNKSKTVKNILLEGNRFMFYTGNVIQGLGDFDNVVLRRNSFLDSYSTEAHSQGLYVSNVSLKLDQNIFIHNGWLVKGYKVPNKTKARQSGKATIYNHNIYIRNSSNVVITNNAFLESSSMHNKLTGTNGENSAVNVLLDNNLYYDGEIGISIGANDKGPFRFSNFLITNNVMLNIGHSVPTNRRLAWGIEAIDLSNSEISSNYIINQNSLDVSNTYGISISGFMKNLSIKKNIIHELKNGIGLILDSNHISTDIKVATNCIALGEGSAALILAKNLTGVSFTGNSYFSANKDAFKGKFTAEKTLINKVKHLLGVNIGYSLYDFEKWTDATRDEHSVWGICKESQTRSIESYLLAIGAEPNRKTFIGKMREQSFANWDPLFSVSKINHHIKNL